jgi:hypothetical protein
MVISKNYDLSQSFILFNNYFVVQLFVWYQYSEWDGFFSSKYDWRLVMGRVLRKMMVLGAFIALSGVSQGAFLVDRSFSTTGANPAPGSGAVWTNRQNIQHWADSFVLSYDAAATGMDIYTREFFGQIGTSVIIRLYADNAGIPGTVLATLNETITLRDTDGAAGLDEVTRIGAVFSSPLALNANTTYWIGMTSSTSDIGQLSLTGPNIPENGSMARFVNTTYSSTNSVGDMAFRLQGDFAPSGAVPAPGGLILAFAAAPALALLRRRKA